MNTATRVLWNGDDDDNAVQKIDISQVEQGRHISHKEEDLLREKFKKTCKLFFILLNVESIRVDLDPKAMRREPLQWKIYRMLLISTSIYIMTANFFALFEILQAPESGPNFSPAMYSDNILVIVLLIDYWRKRSTIMTILNDLIIQLDYYCGTNGQRKVFRRIGYYCNIIFYVGLFNWISLILNMMVEVYLWEDYICDFVLTKFYQLHVPSSMKKPALAAVQINYVILTAIVSLHMSLVIFIVLIIHICFKQLNARLKSKSYVGLRDLHVIQQDHQQLEHLLRRTSEAFSPFLLLAIVLKCTQIVVGMNVMNWGMKALPDHNRGTHVIKTLQIVFNAAGVIVAATTVGGKLQKEVGTITLNTTTTILV